MNYQEFLDPFRRGLVLDSPTVTGVVPDHLAEIWTRRFWRLAKPSENAPPRLLNHFKLGADPEFYMQGNGGRLPAQSMGFRAALAFGADNNGRLCELRPMPNRSALSVVASLASTLRWLHWLRRDLEDVELRGGGWNGQDGIGGHIHFGRKRPTTPREINALDTLTFYLYHSQILDQAGGRERYNRSHNYGRLGDVRQQFHGWEYRTMPSWLDSPWLSFACITLAKLAVLDPELFPVMLPSAELLSRQAVIQRLLGVLAYFQHLDDDAALAYRIWQTHGAPRYDSTNFRPRWGLFAPPPSQPKVDVLPGMIRPSEAEVKELKLALLDGRPPDPVNFEPSWAPSALPTGYRYLPTDTETYHCPGLGELMVGLCTSERYRVNCSLIGTKQARVYVSAGLLKRLPANWVEISREAIGLGLEIIPLAEGRSWQIQFATGLDWKVYTLPLRKWLTCGLFPIWRVDQVNANSSQEWFLRAEKNLAAPAAKAKPAPTISKQL